VNLQDHLGPPAALDAWLERLGRFPGGGWLVIPRRDDILSLETECRPVTTSGRDQSAEEQEELDLLLERSEWRRFLCDDQLQDIVDNLAEQVTNPSRMQILEAIQHYWKHDAFIDAGDA